MSRANLAWTHNNMRPAPAGEATMQQQWATDNGVMQAWGTTVPTDGTSGYGIGCIFQHDDGGNGTALYVNEGTATSCDFNAMMTPNNFNDVVSPAEIITEIESTELADTAAGASPSPLIWNTCPWLQFQLGSDNGITYFSHLTGNHVLAANQAATDIGDGVAGFTGASAGQVISMETDEPTGVMTLTTTNDNESTAVQVWGGLNVCGQVQWATGKKVWMEVRLKVSNITDSKAGLFVGFAEEGLLAEDGIIADGGTLADVDLVGFWRLEGDGDKFDTYHNTSGGGGVTELKADAVTVVADTYLKLGMYCDGTTLTLYKDGAALADTVALAATNFPNGEEMAFYIFTSAAAADDFIVSVDWIRLAKEI